MGMQTIDHILYTGVPVDYYFLPGDQEYIYYGEFKVANNADGEVEIVFDTCELMVDDKPQGMDAFSIHAGEQEVEVTNKKLAIKGHADVHVKITFPFIAVSELKFRGLAIRSCISYRTARRCAIAGINLFYEKGMKE